MRVCSPTNNSSRRETEQFCGGVETYYERSLCTKYRSQGVQTSFYESTPSTPSNSLGDQISSGSRRNFGHAGTNHPHAPKERNNGGPPNSPGFYSNVFLVSKASGGWCPVIDLKNLNAHIHAPHFRMFTTNSVLSSVRKGDYRTCRMPTFTYLFIPAAESTSGSPSKTRCTSFKCYHSV